jgi:hypothetical protein
LVVRVGYRHFWQHQTMYEIHDWLTNDLHLSISEREVAYVFVDFLAYMFSVQSRVLLRGHFKVRLER